MKKSKFAKFVELFASSLAVIFILSCGQEHEKQTKSQHYGHSEPTLVSEVQTALQDGEYEEVKFRPLVSTVSWDEVRQTVESEAEALGMSANEKPSLELKAKLRTLQLKMEAEGSRERQKGILKDIHGELKDMAEEEGLNPR